MALTADRIRDMLTEVRYSVILFLIVGGVLAFVLWTFLSPQNDKEDFSSSGVEEGILIGANWLLPLGILVVIILFIWTGIKSKFI